MDSDAKCNTLGSLISESECLQSRQKSTNPRVLSLDLGLANLEFRAISIRPGVALRIRIQAAQQRHAHWLEKFELFFEFTLKVLGILAALAVVGGLLAASVYCAIIGQKEVAIALASGAGVSTVAGVFLRNFLVVREEWSLRRDGVVF